MQFLLLLSGLIGIVVGLCVIPYSFFELRPRLTELPAQLEGNLRNLDGAVARLEDSRIPTISRNGLHDLSEIGDRLPDTLISMRGALLAASRALIGAADTTQKVKNSAVGTVLPKSNLGVDTSALRKTAVQLRALERKLAGLTPLSSELVRDGRELAAEMNSLLLDVPESLKDIRAQLQGMAGAMDRAELPTYVTLFGCAIGGLYILMGLSSCALAALVGMGVRLARSSGLDSRSLARAA